MSYSGHTYLVRCFYFLMIYMGKKRASNWLKTIAFFLQHECKVVTRVKILNSERCQSFVRLDLL